MKKTIFFLASAIAAQTSGERQVKLAWTPSTTPAVTYNIYVAKGSCPAVTTPFVRVNTAPVTTNTYTDKNVPPGIWCYYGTAEGGELESSASNKVDASVVPAPPTNFTVTVQVAVEVRVNAIEAARQVQVSLPVAKND